MEHSKALGHEATVEALGQTWTLRFDQGVKKGMEEWLADRAYQQLDERRRDGKVSEADYLARVAALDETIPTGVYAWGGRKWAAAMRTDDGACCFLRLLLAKHHGKLKLSDERVTEIYEGNTEGFEAAFARVLSARPNGQAPAATNAPAQEETMTA